MFRRTLRMFALILPYKRQLFLLILAGLMYAAANVVLVKTVQFTCRTVLKFHGATGKDIFPVWFNEVFQTTDLSQKYCFFLCLTLLLLCSIFMAIGVYYRRYIAEWIGYRVVVDTQSQLARHLLDMDFVFFQKQRIGELLSRLTNDLFLLTRTVLLLGTFLTRPILLVSLLFVLFTTNWEITLYGLAGAPIASIAFLFLSRKIRKTSSNAQKQLANVTDAMVRFLSGINIVKAFAKEDFEYKLFCQQNEHYFKEVTAREKQVSRERPIISSTTKLGLLFALFIGGNMILRGAMTPDELFSFITALAMMYDPMKELSRGNSELQVSIPGAERVFEILDSESDKRTGGRVLKKINNSIDFTDMSFEYVDGTPVLRNINLNVKKGQTIAIVGPSGSGKTTILHLLLRFFDVSKGKITIDDQDIREFSLSSLRGKIALVSQSPFLFNCNISDNIAYGHENAFQEDIIAAAKAANVHDEIMLLPHGYDTVVGERGEKLSGGQRQRVTIARAIYKNPPILLLDEATSALDSESEKKVQSALDKLMKDRTSIVVAHRLSTVRNADMIVVLEAGQIIGMGKHDELYNNNPTYAKLCKLQETSSAKTLADESDI